MNQSLNNQKLLKPRFFGPGIFWFIISVISVIILSIYNLIISWQLQKIIDIAANNDSTSLSLVLLIATISFLIFIIAYAIYRTARPRFIQIASERYKADIFQNLLYKRIGTFSQENVSKMVSILTNDIRSIEDNYLDCMLTLIDIGISFIGALILMLWYSPALTIAAVLLSVLPIIISISPAKKLSDAERELSDANANFIEIINDMLSGFTVIKSFRAENEIAKRFNSYNSKIEHIKYKRRYEEENVNLLSTAASVITRLGVFFIGAWMVISEQNVTPGIVLVFLQLVTFVISPIESVPTILANRKASIAIMDRISHLLLREDIAKYIETPLNITQSISIKNLSYGYTETKEILHNINMTFEAGKKYAIVGSTGSGKTTLLNLLLQTYDTYSGTIVFDDFDLTHIHPASLFKTVSLVQQNVFIFNDTIKNNITLYKNFSEHAIQNALQLSGLNELISEKGLDYICGEKGCLLSGGEKQRISIARALIRNASILLMDEATASLDEITTKGIMNAILGLKNTTCIVVTHNLDQNILKKYDGIFVLHKGTIKEQGTFNELMRKQGFFYALYTVSQ